MGPSKRANRQGWGRRTRGHRSVARLTAVVAAAAALGAPAFAFPAYSEDPDNDTGYCAACHGNFDGDDYTSLQDGTLWNNSLMDAHREWLNNTCTACHQSPGEARSFSTTRAA